MSFRTRRRLCRRNDVSFGAVTCERATSKCMATTSQPDRNVNSQQDELALHGFGTSKAARHCVLLLLLMSSKRIDDAKDCRPKR